MILENGEFAGFQLRPDLAKVILLKGNKNYQHIRRVLKICIFFNRMLKHGLSDDFELQQFKDGQLVE